MQLSLACRVASVSFTDAVSWMHCNTDIVMNYSRHKAVVLIYKHRNQTKLDSLLVENKIILFCFVSFVCLMFV